MKKEFEAKVKAEGIVDTKEYRYVYTADERGARIERLALDKLDTTAAYDGWETIKEYSQAK